MKFKRSSGILLHPTSLPGEYGIGDLGPQALKWIDFLSVCGCSLWQVLPLGPTGYADSPYQSFSAFAGNIYLISPDELISDGLLTIEDVQDKPNFFLERVDYGTVIPWKLAILERTYNNFIDGRRPDLKQDFSSFKQENIFWIENYSLFMALKEKHASSAWITWEEPLRLRQSQYLDRMKIEQKTAIERYAFYQFIFFRQWRKVHNYAREHNISIIGDIPIFVAHDSAEVWANPELFYLDKSGQPISVAGVPPDYFSPTGQLWGNPLYRWQYHKEMGYSWWISRLRSVLSMVDIVRLDHFRGFSGYWEIPGNETTAINGQWKPGPGKDLFKTIQQNLGDLPIIAEDLGVITPDVVKLRQSFHLPGMKILVFAFDTDPEDPDLPHHFTEDSVVYTGTHDNDTVWGWYQRVDEKERDLTRRYLRTDGHDIAWDMIRAAWASISIFALAPMQDILNLGNEARMNYPSRPDGNWQWRMQPGMLRDDLVHRLAELNWLYSRSKDSRSSG